MKDKLFLSICEMKVIYQDVYFNFLIWACLTFFFFLKITKQFTFNSLRWKKIMCHNKINYLSLFYHLVVSWNSCVLQEKDPNIINKWINNNNNKQNTGSLQMQNSRKKNWTQRSLLYCRLNNNTEYNTRLGMLNRDTRKHRETHTHSSRDETLTTKHREHKA